MALCDHQKHCCFRKSLSAFHFGAEFILEVQAQGLQRAAGGILGAKSLTAGTRKGQAVVMAPGGLRHVGRATCKICKITCREDRWETGSGWGCWRSCLGAASHLCFLAAGQGSAVGGIWFVWFFSHESLCFDFPWGTRLWTLLCISYLQLHLTPQ